MKEGCKSHRIWGHGYVGAWFEGYDKALCLKRYICADCGCIYTIRPLGYWPRHHVPIRIIFRSLCHRVTQGVWDRTSFTKQRQGHWLRALGRNIRIVLGLDFTGDLMEGFFELLHRGRVPVVRML